MSGRKKNKAYDELGYELVKINNKHAACCNFCKKNLSNTAEVRLKAHRNVCRVTNKKDETNDTGLPTVDAPVYSLCEVLLLESDGLNCSMGSSSIGAGTKIQDDVLVYTKNVETNSSDSKPSTRSSSATPSHTSTDQLLSFLTSNSSKNRKRPLSMNSQPEEEGELNESLAEFFFGCNIPLSVVESVNFKNFVKKLRPSYADKVPGREALSTKLLDNAYKKCLSSTMATMSSDSVLLIDGWKSPYSNTKTVVSMLHSANGEQAFLEAWNLTGESETAEELADIVSQSVDMADKVYSTHVYAVVSDNAGALEKMEEITIWKSNCSSHTGNLLAEDILNIELNLKVASILKEFNQTDLEKKLVEKGGTRIKLPCDTRCCSHRDAYICLIKNAQFMKLVAADSKVKETVVAMLCDSKLMDDVKSTVLLLNPICNLINKCQSSSCSAAEAVEMWLDLQLPDEFSEKLKTWQEQALNKYALAAFYLHPFLDNAKLRSEHNIIVFDFLFQSLDGAALEEWDSFRNRTGFFKILYEKDIRKPLVFWNMAEIKHPTLAKLAKKLLQIPASSAQIGRLFSIWPHVHAPVRNCLEFEKSKKLLHIYYSLRMKDDLAEEEEEEDFE